MLKRSASFCRGDWYSVRIMTPPKSKKTARIAILLRNYFFLGLVSTVFWAAGFLTAVFFSFEADVVAETFAGFLLTAFSAGFFSFEDDFAGVFFSIASFIDFEIGSVLRKALAGVSTLEADGGGEATNCFIASCQLGKNNSIRWREMELARRQRGQ